MGDTSVALVDVNTENKDVVMQYTGWIANFVQEYGIDGLRIDAAKHIRHDFWTGFCSAAGVFCIGEVFGPDIQYVAQLCLQTTNQRLLQYCIFLSSGT